MLRKIENIDFSTKKLIIPSVSVGNIGQLSVDLLISSLKLKKVGIIWDPAIIPLLGGNAYGNTNDLSTACELFGNEECTYCVLQLRSGLYKNTASKFLTKLAALINEHKFQEVVILTSCFAYEKHTIGSSPFRYLVNEAQYSKQPVDSSEWQALECPSLEEARINGGGFALKLLKILNSTNVKSMLIMKYCSEGDNVPDAIQMLSFINEYIGVFKDLRKEMVFPPSWELLFGGPPPIGIY